MKSLVSSISLSITAVLLFFATYSNAQVGIGTSIPQAAMDITSTNAGLLLPRIALTSATVAAPVTNPSGGAVVPGTMVWNTGTGGVTPAGYYYWENSRWNQVAVNQKQVHFGKFIISSAGNLEISGLGFRPSSIEFVAVNRVQAFNQRANRATRGATSVTTDNNTNDIRMAGGISTGYATNYSGVILQQAVSYGHNGSSINNTGTYASENHCITAFFVNNNGEALRDNGTTSGGTIDQDGLIRASMSSFNVDGFTINVDRFTTGIVTNPGNATNEIDRTNRIVVTFKAYR